MRLPRVYYKPGPDGLRFRVEVTRVSEERLNALADRYEHAKKEFDGLFLLDHADGNGGTIYLSNRISGLRLWFAFEHENDHAETEWRTWSHRKAGIE